MSAAAVSAPADLSPQALDLSPEAIRLALAPAVIEAVAFDGWHPEAVLAAATAHGVAGEAALYAFGTAPMGWIAAFAARVDADMAQALPAELLAGLKVRERIRRLVAFRLMAWQGREEALRRALAILALPVNVPAALKLGWHSADLMWRLAGDTATDFNHYTKRTTLAAIYSASLAVMVGDTSDDKADTMAFLDRRIDGVMRFEKAKARLKPLEGRYFSPVRLLGRLRYPAR